jgi:RNA polymerase sigma-70 factor, ECF subfamily
MVLHTGIDDLDAQADVAQRSLIKVWQRGHTFRGEAPLDHWLRRVVRNEAISWMRREAARPRGGAAALDHMASRERDVAELVVHRLVAERLLSGLDAMDRKIVELRFLEEMNSREIASTLGLADSTVRCRILRLRGRLNRDPAVAKATA